MGWWERLLGDLTATHFIIVMDDVQVLGHSTRGTANLAPLARAIQQLADRRGSCRVALVAADLPEGLVDPRLSYVTMLRLLPFTWAELWVWIRRNLPALTRFGKAGLAECYTQLGNDLAAWRELATRLTHQPGPFELSEAVGAIAQARQSTTHPAAAAPPGTTATPRPQRALRVAIATTRFVKSPDAFANAMTSLAAQYAVGGRVVTGEQTASTFAELLPISSPFNEEGLAPDRTVVRWLQDLEGRVPDIVLLDYGAENALKEERNIIPRLASDALLIAAAGNDGHGRPDSYPDALTTFSRSARSLVATKSPPTPRPESGKWEAGDLRAGKAARHGSGTSTEGT